MVIIAINLPLALLFAFGAAASYLRNQSANLLSIGAVDFGIIIDSTVIMVENIYRVLSTGKYADLPLKERIVKAAREVERSFVVLDAHHGLCKMLPLFTMRGPEGQLFSADGRDLRLCDRRGLVARTDTACPCCACCCSST